MELLAASILIDAHPGTSNAPFRSSDPKVNTASFYDLNPHPAMGAPGRVHADLRTARTLYGHGDYTDSGPPSGHSASGGARTRNRRVPADLKMDSLSTVPPTPQLRLDRVRNFHYSDMGVALLPGPPNLSGFADS
ncbi:hypothetical protein PoB_004975100 [Plakobranchus ocellatus]|uniref:Uncharacterized protein n=1 Tax=Plakobranchus ocellatus TaxID=259542 RepID=A0AAV4BIN7_9GAST|nr:hypothetical protein PoB_004975100 [Plakobranchus ocellatus]